MLKPMRIACDDRRFITIYVVSVVAVTVRMAIFVLVFMVVMVRFPRGMVVMDVRMVSSAVPMIKRAHELDRMRPNRRWSLYRRKENHPSAVTSMRRPVRDGAE
jgi:hypothetical protein